MTQHAENRGLENAWGAEGARAAPPPPPAPSQPPGRGSSCFSSQQVYLVPGGSGAVAGRAAVATACLKMLEKQNLEGGSVRTHNPEMATQNPGKKTK